MIQEKNRNRLSGDAIAKQFSADRYVLIKNLVPTEMTRYLREYFKILATANRMGRDAQCPHSLCIGHDAGFDAVLEWIRPTISGIADVDLVPTYSYARIYAVGEELKRHRDRPSCEFSVTIAIAVPDGGEPSSIFMKAPRKKQRRVDMLEGDGCVYAGTEVEHWREPFRSDGYFQLFLHFISKGGPYYPDYTFDRRKSLGLPWVGQRG